MDNRTLNMKRIFKNKEERKNNKILQNLKVQKHKRRNETQVKSKKVSDI